MIEHNLEVIKTAGNVAAVKESYTGQYLKDLLGRRANALRSSEGAEGVNRQRKDKTVKKQAAE